MDIFINEWSFQGQFHEKSTFDKAITVLVRLIDCARQAIQRRHGTMWRSHRLEGVSGTRTQPLVASMNHISNREIREAFRDVVFNKANPVPWETNSLQKQDVSYAWRRQPEAPPDVHEDVSGTSMAELAERQYQDPALDGCLLNLVDSSLSGRTVVTIVRAATTDVRVASFESAKDLKPWLEQVGGVPPYKEDARTPPRDEQTCLRNKQVFESVTQPAPVQGRQVYRHLTSGRYYYVDNLHHGAAAHLEVFSKRGRHEGEADLDGNLKPNTKDRKKQIDV